MAASLMPSLLREKASAQSTTSAAHVDVANIDHDRILKAAEQYLTQAPVTLTAFASPHSPGGRHDFYSDATDWWHDSNAPSGPYVYHEGVENPKAFKAHSDALLLMAIQLPTLTAAYILTREARYADHAAAHLRAWFIDPQQRMTPNFSYGQMIPGNPTSRLEGVIEAVHLAEVAQAMSYLTRYEGLDQAELDLIYAWFAAYLDWLTTSRLAGLARDQKNHHGSSWLLQAAAITRLLPVTSKTGDNGLAILQHQFKTVTIRAQISPDGSFQHELTTINPYRNSLFNLDMLAGACSLLTSRFESLWNHELQDGPGMRVAVARHFPFTQDRGRWPYRADATHFNDLPLRQPNLILAGRAYARPEYIDLWKTLNPDPIDLTLQRTFPIRQPLLWIRRTPAL